jgi:hypothetical protein
MRRFPGVVLGIFPSRQAYAQDGASGERAVARFRTYHQAGELRPGRDQLPRVQPGSACIGPQSAIVCTGRKDEQPIAVLTQFDAAEESVG